MHFKLLSLFTHFALNPDPCTLSFTITLHKHKIKGPSKKHQKRKLRAANARFNRVAGKISNSTSTSHIGKKKKLKNAKWKSQRENPRPNKTSINIKDSWIPMTEIWFNNTFKTDSIMDLQKSPKYNKLITAGRIHGVLTKYDGLRYSPQPLQSHRYATVESFECKPASTDPYIVELARKNKGNIYTTDNVLSAIMCCQRSKYSFDFIVSKIGNNIFLDERNKGLSGYSVDETSITRPTKYKQPKIDYYTSLAFEAEAINYVFHEQMLYQNNLDHIKRLSRPHPYNNNKNGKNGTKRKKMAVSSQGFSYNLYNISKNMQVICRCGIDGNDDEHNNIKLCALNQYNHNKSQTHDWTRDLNKKQTAILREEIRNNNFKCARWGIKAKLSDSKYVKLGFVAREKNYKIDKHQIVGVKTFETRDYLKKFGIKSLRDPWNIFIRFINKIKDIEVDGRFIVIRDPLYQVFRIYKIENESFTQDDIASFAGLKKIVKH